MDLSNLKPPAGATHPKKRVGRGQGSGNGKTAGRGHKGAQSRSGYKSKRGFEGGQMPLHRRVPKRGFHNPFRVDYAVVNLDAIAKKFEADTVVTPELLREHGMVAGARSKIKVLARGDIAKKLTIRAHRFSGKAAEKIVAAGGAAETLGQDGLPPSDNGPRTERPRASGTGPRTGGPRASGTGPRKETV